MDTQTYFLGSNSANGFFSAYHHFCTPEDNNFLWVIKGGPGCGKSSFMKKVGKAAEDAGLDVEYVICSGDPDSLDGIYIPEKKIGYVDGTAPHTIDVPFPGAYGLYLDLGQFYDKTALQKKADIICKINSQYKEQYRKAYAILSAIPRTFASSSIPPECKTRFHTAISCKGIVSILPNKKIVEISKEELNQHLKNAESSDIIYLHPLWPDCVYSIYSKKDDILYTISQPMNECSSAITYLSQAKALHDQLEEIYNPHVDFDGVYKMAVQHITNNL